MKLQSKPSQKPEISKVLAFALFLLVLFLGSFYVLQSDKLWGAKVGTGNNDNYFVYSSLDTSGNGEGNSSQELFKFKNVNELNQFLLERGATSGSSNYGSRGVSEGMAVSKDMATPTAAPSANAGASMGGSGASEYSQTNVQVEGVDEADFVKNDGQYIYIISGNKLVIVDAYDAANAKIVSKTTIDTDDTSASPQSYYGYGSSRELFISGNNLAVFVQKYERSFYFEKYDIMPRETYKQKTYVYIYDVSDKSKPKVVNTYSVSGSYFQSRLKDGIIYLVTQEGVNYGYIEPPLVRDSGVIAVKPEIYYFDNPDENYQFNTITSIDMNNDRLVDTKTFMLGYSNTLMVSENNIYIAYQKHNRWCWSWRCYGGNSLYESDRFYKVVVPLLEGSLKTDVQDIMSQTNNETERWDLISQKLADFFSEASKNETMKDQYSDMLTNIQDALQEYDTKQALEDSKTVIQKIGIDNGKLTYSGKGEVDGSLLNQFSLDEYNGNLRVATTVSVWLSKQVQYNNVYVLSPDMNIIGSLENLAKDERIYSTRFIGDKLYMVTFRQVDPFFVIDLSQVTDPKVLGYLKIPGYSDYLHPYDATHVIGVGKDTTTTDYNTVQTTGIKISLFDVSDFENPKEVDKVVIGEAGSDSAALHDHKAFLFSPTKNILVIPVTEITSRDKDPSGMYSYSYTTWNGAYVFKVSPSGFTQEGKIKHSSSTSGYWNWWNEATVQRSLYLDNNLYTISNKYIKINDLNDNLAELNTINLPYEDTSSVWGKYTIE